MVVGARFAPPPSTSQIAAASPRAPARVPIRRFRVATTQTVVIIFGCFAWRASHLAERAAAGLSAPGARARRGIVAVNVAGAVVAACRASRHKRLLKSILGADLALEVVTLLGALLCFVRPDASQLPWQVHGLTAMHSAWLALIAAGCARSRWITSVPTVTATAAGQPPQRANIPLRGYAAQPRAAPRSCFITSALGERSKPPFSDPLDESGQFLVLVDTGAPATRQDCRRRCRRRLRRHHRLLRHHRRPPRTGRRHRRRPPMRSKLRDGPT